MKKILFCLIFIFPLFAPATIIEPDTAHPLVRKGDVSLSLRLKIWFNGVDTRSEDGTLRTSLHVASAYGHTEIVKFLLEKGANVNARDKVRSTPLHMAAYSGNLEIVKLLIENEADVNATDLYGQTPLHLAAYDDLETATLLVENGADVNAKAEYDRTPLSYAASYGRIEISAFLISKEADITIGGADNTPLHRAIESGHTDTVAFFIGEAEKKGIDLLNITDEYNRTPLHYAISHSNYRVTHINHVEIVTLLISAGAKLNIGDIEFNNTPLHIAAGFGLIEIVKLLVNAGADVNALNDFDRTPLQKATEYMNADADVVKFLKENGTNENIKSKGSDISLHTAISNRDLETIKLLIEQGVDVEARDYLYNTPLHIASSYGYAEIAALLVNAGANVNARNDQHETPLHDAASEGSLEIVKLLLENGAYVNARDRSKQTAFSYAYRDRGFSEHKQAIMDLLESAGAWGYPH